MIRNLIHDNGTKKEIFENPDVNRMNDGVGGKVRKWIILFT